MGKNRPGGRKPVRAQRIPPRRGGNRSPVRDQAHAESQPARGSGVLPGRRTPSALPHPLWHAAAGAKPQKGCVVLRTASRPPAPNRRRAHRSLAILQAYKSQPRISGSRWANRCTESRIWSRAILHAHKDSARWRTASSGRTDARSARHRCRAIRSRTKDSPATGSMDAPMSRARFGVRNPVRAQRICSQRSKGDRSQQANNDTKASTTDTQPPPKNDHTQQANSDTEARTADARHPRPKATAPSRRTTVRGPGRGRAQSCPGSAASGRCTGCAKRVVNPGCGSSGGCRRGR